MNTKLKVIEHTYEKGDKLWANLQQGFHGDADPIPLLPYFTPLTIIAILLLLICFYYVYNIMKNQPNPYIHTETIKQQNNDNDPLFYLLFLSGFVGVCILIGIIRITCYIYSDTHKEYHLEGTATIQSNNVNTNDNQLTPSHDNQYKMISHNRVIYVTFPEGEPLQAGDKVTIHSHHETLTSTPTSKYKYLDFHLNEDEYQIKHKASESR